MANSVFGLKRTRTGFSVCISKRNIKTIGFVLFILAVVICYILYMYYFQFSKFQNMMYGLGVFGTAGHSAAAREGSLGETLQIFKNSPIIGCSLGDLDGRVARIRGLLYRGETGMTMSIFAEQFAATGIVGGFCFVLYIIKMCFGYRKYKKYNLEYLNFVKGLCLGLIFQTLILNMNQNVLRPYFWLNIAVLSVAYRGFAYMLPKEEGREK